MIHTLLGVNIGCITWKMVEVSKCRLYEPERHVPCTLILPISICCLAIQNAQSHPTNAINLPSHSNAWNTIHYYVIIGSWPFSFILGGSRPSSIWAGRSFLESRAEFSAQDLSLTRLRIAASRRWFWFVRIALLTRSATLRRRSGCNISASCGSKLLAGNTSRAIVLSRSSKKAGCCGARGANCSVAKVKAGVISPPGVELHDRMSSTSWSRSRAKCRAGFLSSSYHSMLSVRFQARQW